MGFSDDQLLLNSFLIFDGSVVGSEYQLLNLLFSQVLLQVFYDFCQALLGDDFLVFLFVDEQLVSLLDILCAVFLAHLHYHDLQELLKVDFGLIKLCTLLARPEVPYQIAYLLVAWVEAQSSQDYLQVLCLNCARTRSVKEIKCFFDLVLLRGRQNLLIVQYLLTIIGLVWGCLALLDCWLFTHLYFKSTKFLTIKPNIINLISFS